MGLAAGGAALAGAPSLAAENDANAIGLPQALRSKIAARLARDQIPAIAVCAIKDGVPLVIDSVGQASLPFGVAATERTLFHFGSISKHVTAAAILRLVEAGRIGLDDPVGRHARDLPPSLAGFTIRALLSHTAGVPDYGLLAGRPDTGVDRPVSRTAFVKAVGELTPGFAPGEAWSYSNTGYVLLGYVIADVSGRTYREFVTEELLRPAKLREARVDDAPAIIAGRAEPYELQKGVLRHAVMMDGDYSGWPDGGLLFSARDAARWEAGLQADSAIPAAAQRQMTTPIMLSTGRDCAYGLGWYTDRVRGRALQYHGGSVPGFLAFYLRVPAERVGVVALTNLGSGVGEIALRRTVQDLAELIAPGSTPMSLRPIRDPDSALTAEARAMLTRGPKSLDASRFAAEIAPLLGRPAGARPSPPNRAGRGPMSTFELVETFAEGAGQVRRYRATFGEEVEHFAFAHAPDGKIYRVRGY